MNARRYALVGVGGRGSGMFAQPLAKDFAETARLVAVCDANPVRVEYALRYGTGWAIGGQRLTGVEEHQGESLRLFIAGKGIREIAIRQQKGGHGGADPRLRAEFFGTDWNHKPSGRMASLEEGVHAVLVGVAANCSIANGKTVDVQRLLRSR